MSKPHLLMMNLAASSVVGMRYSDELSGFGPLMLTQSDQYNLLDTDPKLDQLGDSPSSIVSAFSECCVEVPYLTRLSVAYAFGGLICSFVAVGTAVPLVLWQAQEAASTLKEAVVDLVAV